MNIKAEPPKTSRYIGPADELAAMHERLDYLHAKRGTSECAKLYQSVKAQLLAVWANVVWNAWGRAAN